MSSPAANLRSRGGFEIWPGFVDALATLLMVIIFLLMVFVLAQFYLSAALTGRDEALERLSRQIAETARLLAVERETNAELRINLAQLASELQSSGALRDALQVRVSDLTQERDSVAARLADAQQTVRADRATIETQLKDLERLNRDIATLREMRQDLETKVLALAGVLEGREKELAEATERGRVLDLRVVILGRDLEAKNAELAEALERAKALGERVVVLGDTLAGRERELTAARDRSRELEARLSTAEERTALAQRQIEDRDIRLSELIGRAEGLERQLSAEAKLSRDAQDQVELVNRQLIALRQQLARLEAALDASEARTSDQQAQIVDLGRRLNLALASKVEELARYRSEFFGRLRELLGERQDVRVVGDRFVFQSEVLFASGSATMGLDGQEQLWHLAQTLKEIVSSLPKELNWVLQVDGHTDTVPIVTPQFPSNWELSTARATSVVKFLIQQGLPAQRLAAAGYGEFHPLDPGNDDSARRRNRRIELKLTTR
jgi:chemotaxis protein MotB